MINRVKDILLTDMTSILANAEAEAGKINYYKGVIEGIKLLAEHVEKELDANENKQDSESGAEAETADSGDSQKKQGPSD